MFYNARIGAVNAGVKKQKAQFLAGLSAFAVGGVDGTRTRDPRRDRPVF
jgi:hypothetical protein